MRLIKQFREIRYLSALKYYLDFFPFFLLSLLFQSNKRRRVNGWNSFSISSRDATARRGGLLNLLMNQIRWEQFKCCTNNKGQKTPSHEIKIIVIFLKGIIAIARSIYVFMFLPGKGEKKYEEWEMNVNCIFILSFPFSRGRTGKIN